MANRLTKWSVDSRPQRILHDDDTRLLDDMDSILGHFAYVTNANKAHIHLPPSLKRGEKRDLGDRNDGGEKYLC